MRARYRWMLGTALLGLGLFALTAWRMPEIAAWRWRLVAGQPAMNTSGIALTAPLRWFDDYFAVAELSEDAYAIGEPRYGQCNFSYLIVGSKRALLFDTGPGVRDIYPVVLSRPAHGQAQAGILGIFRSTGR
jgi:hypothetical protein